MKQLIYITLIGFNLFNITGKAQIAVTYIPFQSIFGISSNVEKLMWVDYKIETNNFASSLDMEISQKINFKRKEIVNYYVGPGFSFNPAYSFVDLPFTNGYFIEFGTRIKPIAKFKNIQLMFELSPYINNKLNNGYLRTRLGFSYNFIPKSKVNNELNKENTVNAR